MCVIQVDAAQKLFPPYTGRQRKKSRKLLGPRTSAASERSCWPRSTTRKSPAASARRSGLRDPGALPGRAGAAADGAPGRALSDPIADSSWPEPAPKKARGHSEPPARAAGPPAGHVQAVHRSGDLRGRSRHSGLPVLVRTAAGAAG